MTKILFVCLGNICRSPMAEFIFKNLAKNAGLEKDFYVESAGISDEEEGNDIHSGAASVLSRKGIPFESRKARQITDEDYKKFDLIIGMDITNLYRMENRWNKDPDDKIKLMFSYLGKDRDIADPWYTHDFETAYSEIEMCCKALLERLTNEA